MNLKGTVISSDKTPIANAAIELHFFDQSFSNVSVLFLPKLFVFFKCCLKIDFSFFYIKNLKQKLFLMKQLLKSTLI